MLIFHMVMDSHILERGVLVGNPKPLLSQEITIITNFVFKLLLLEPSLTSQTIGMHAHCTYILACYYY